VIIFVGPLPALHRCEGWLHPRRSWRGAEVHSSPTQRPHSHCCTDATSYMSLSIRRHLGVHSQEELRRRLQVVRVDKLVWRCRS